ncbi:MAG TPA: hypothetical protein PKA20_01440 [Burkholderiaceae bacterium]|nr:hypothetical protein [Burkholderiaceae bacterium]
MSWRHCSRFVGTIIATAAALLVLVTALPHDKYLRYKALIDQQAPTADWIYERIHFDPAPIDIAFIGTSRTGLSIQSRRLEQKLAEGGLDAKAANLHIVRTGNNMHYAVAKELLENRRVGLLVLEITESEERRPHPAFMYLADTEDIVLAPLIINLRYFDDLIRLPGRQIDLFGRSMLAKIASPDGLFDITRYKGSNLDHGESITTEDGVVRDRNQSHSVEHMENLLKDQLARDTPPAYKRIPFLQDRLRELEYRFPRLMMNRIIDLARSKETGVVLVYLPRYGGPDEPPAYREVFSSKVDLINAKPALNDARYWWDVPHVNAEGSRRVTDLVAEAILQRGYLARSTYAKGHQ